MVIDLNKKINEKKENPAGAMHTLVKPVQGTGFAIARPQSGREAGGSSPRRCTVTNRVAEGVFENAEAGPVSHAAEPLKKMEDICKVQDYMISHGMLRDNLLFVCGINFGLRISDLLKLQVGHLLNAQGNAYNDRIVLTEQKTGKRRVVYMNEAVMDAADLYFGDMVVRRETINLNDYLFTARSANVPKQTVLSSRSVERILKDVINDKCGIPVHASTHCLRKTFAYHVIMTAKDRSRAIEFLQKMLGHSSQAITLMYAGITDEEIMKTYQELNLGSMRSRARIAWDVNRSSGLKASSQQAPAVNQ